MTERQFDECITAFCKRLEGLAPGESARLRRCAGRTPAQATESLGLFYRLLPPGIPSYQEKWYFLLATLHPLATSAESGNLGDALNRACHEQNRLGIERRVETLLDADEDQLAFRLRQAVRLVHANGVGVCWPQLLYDLLHWAHPDRFVQMAWARSYYRSQPQPENDR